MTTPRQLFRGTRKLKTTTKILNNSPQKKAHVQRIYTANPKKPNSARRAVVRVKLADGSEKTIFVPGEKHNLKEFSEVLVEGRGAKDLPGIRSKVVPGALDSPGIEGRKNSRSRYGTSKPKK